MNLSKCAVNRMSGGNEGAKSPAVSLEAENLWGRMKPVTPQHLTGYWAEFPGPLDAATASSIFGNVENVQSATGPLWTPPCG